MCFKLLSWLFIVYEVCVHSDGGSPLHMSCVPCLLGGGWRYSSFLHVFATSIKKRFKQETTNVTDEYLILFSRTSLTNLGLGFSRSTVRQSDLRERERGHVITRRHGNVDNRLLGKLWLRPLTSHPSSIETGSCSSDEKTSWLVYKWKRKKGKRWIRRQLSHPAGRRGRAAGLPVDAAGVHGFQPHVQHLCGLGQLTGELTKELQLWLELLSKHTASYRNTDDDIYTIQKVWNDLEMSLSFKEKQCFYQCRSH